MTTTSTRPLGWLIAALAAVAFLAHPAINAQPATPGAGDVTSTTCGGGTLYECGYENKTECTQTVEVKYTYRGVEVTYGKGPCTNHGETRIYKDRPTTNNPLSPNQPKPNPKDPCANLANMVRNAPGNPCLGRTP